MTVIPCYQFGLEPYQLYPEVQLIVNMVTQYTGNLGSPFLAVADVAEPLTFLGFGLNDGDQVRWILRGEEDCESNLASLTQPDTLAFIDTVTLDASNAAFFNFTTSQVDFSPVLCYKFGEENFKLYPNMSIGIGTIRTKSTATGAKDVAVVGARKNFTLSGTNLAESDRIGWTTVPNSCADLSLLARNPANFDDDYQSYLTAANTFGVALTELSSGKRVYLCYGFGNEPLKVFPDLYMDVKSITNMRTLVGSPNVAVAGAAKTFLFDGDGVVTGDFAKFVSSDETDCSNPGITLVTIMKEFDDYDQMAMYLYETVKGVTTTSFQVSADTYSVGLNCVLCYRFGVEPFFYYEDFHIDVKAIWGLHQFDTTAGGQNNVMVVNEPKLMIIDGVGMSEKDTLKFVSAGPNTDDADCVGLASQGLVLQQLKVTSNSTVWLPFEFGSKGGTWELCYKFDDEPFCLYSAVSITVKEITALLDYTFQDIADLGSVATIGHLKQWKPVGSGVQEGDSIKIVSHSVTGGAECGQNDANLATGTSIMTVSGADLIFSGVITAFPVSTSDVYHLCYRFQDEPFTYVRGFTLTTYGVIGLDRSVVLVSASTLAQVSGFRISDTDQMGWTTSSTSCSSMFGLATVSGLQASLLFSTRYTQLALCYSFNNQPFSIFPSVTLDVVTAEIWIPQTVSIIADQTMELLVSGTFGITQGSDQIAWIPSDVAACSADTMSAYGGVMQTTVASVSKSQTIIPRAGEATFNVKFVAPSSGSGLTVSDSFSTWKLCYRFGSTLNYLMFGDVLCSVLNINQVQLLDLEPSSSGAVMKFEFDGVGTQDFDSAKWVDASLATIDSDCDTLPAIGGSEVRDVVNSRATFTFVEESAAMALCYRFQGHAFKLFANIPIQDSSKSTSSSGQHTTDAIATNYDEEAAAAASDQFTLSREIATVSLTLDKDISEIPAGSAAETAFKASFISTLARSLGIDPSRIQITDLVAGSVIVNFQLLPSESAADPLVGEIIDDLQSQLLDSTSALLDSHTIAVKDAATALSLSLTTPPESAASSMAIQAIGYQQSGLFSFVRSIYSVTERSSSLVIPVIRLQGTSTVVSLIVQIQSKGTTATYNEDYAFSSSATFDNTLQLLYLRFDIGETLQTIELEILDDSVKEAHFESIYLVLQAPQISGAALGTMKQTSIRIYDYDDGIELVRSSFAPNDQPDPLQGWQVVANSASILRIDASGVFAVDDVFGEAEYDQKCDLAAPTGECTYTCELGGGLAPANGLESVHNVLLLGGDDYAATMNVVSAFPTDAFTVSLWVKTTQADAAACLYSYAVSSETAPAVPFALCNPANLQLYINSESDVSGLATFVNVSDGLWHFLALTWNSEDGRARIFDNGMLAFDGGPYRGGQSLEGDGVFVVGHLVLSSATQAVCTVGAEALALGGSSSSNALLPATAEDLSCDVVTNSGFKGQIQHVHVWSRVLARSELLGELAWPLRVVSNGLVLGWNFGSSFLLLQGRVVKDLSMQGQEQQNPGVLHCNNHHDNSDTLLPSTAVGNNSSSIASSCLLPDALPGLDATFPCGPVYTNIWHFSAPTAFTAQLGAAYGGHLQFRLLAPSFNGSPRPRRGQVSIFSTDTTGEVTHISVGLGSFDLPSASRWTYYSVVLREDFGWITEPAGKSLTGAEFKMVLARASALWIRGDIWGYDASGQGQEVVYLNDVALYAR
ncbi:hypothetical protein BBJ28_00022166 [Nothophytophthora sp. Chile5]|nr:hypothetical protein BBJ28_00022166 [Nothophytophthora sp. Chile5]